MLGCLDSEGNGWPFHRDSCSMDIVLETRPVCEPADISEYPEEADHEQIWCDESVSMGLIDERISQIWKNLFPAMWSRSMNVAPGDIVADGNH